MYMNKSVNPNWVFHYFGLELGKTKQTEFAF